MLILKILSEAPRPLGGGVVLRHALKPAATIARPHDREHRAGAQKRSRWHAGVAHARICRGANNCSSILRVTLIWCSLCCRDRQAFSASRSTAAMELANGGLWC